MSANGDTPAATGPDRADAGPPAEADGHPEPEHSQGANDEALDHTQNRHDSAAIKGKFNDKKEQLKDKANPPGGFDSTPIPEAPPGYTIKFTFHKATNLPVADLGTRASDPYLHATLTTSLMKRHKEDPELTHRTRTIRRSTEPEWEEEWIVANVPPTGCKLKCRLYDEDWPDHDDRLGNVSLYIGQLSENWEGFTNQQFSVKKRVGSKRAYLLKAATSLLSKDSSMTPILYLSATMVGKSNSLPNGQLYTVGPTSYFRHFSPMIGRLAGIQDDSHSQDKKTKKYDFQATEIQLQGPVPPKLYHRYVEFRPFVGRMFSRHGVRGHILHKALTHQHKRIYNFDKHTEYGKFEPCSEEASLQFLKLVHFDQGGRIFTYVITLDGLFRFTETGKEFGIDMLSKHTMHSDVATYIACSGEFFVRRLQKPTGSDDPDPGQPTHPDSEIPGGPPSEAPPTKPEYYQLVIDNDSGTYRPDKSILPDLQKFLEKNFPGLGIITLACDDDRDQELKAAQRKIKKTEGEYVQMILNRSPSASSFSSDDISDLEDMERAGDAGRKSKKERALDILEQGQPLEELKKEVHHIHK
ncbi:c2 domain-containing protein [Xylariales sp. PMI_506]|nr:c2 domain-containing protein [Xylariales sp. PMI_506]